MSHILGKDRNQLQFLSLEQVVPRDSRARVIDFFVGMLPLDEPGFKHANPEKEGRPPYNPSTLLKLYLYGYKHSIRSSRKLAYSCCKVNVELWWLLRGLTPSFRTIAYFRKENADAFKASFRRFVLMLKELDIIEGETIAIDSFKIFAQNGLRNNFNQKKIDRHIDYIDRKIEEYEKELNESDAKDKELIKVRIVSHLTRKKKYEELDKSLKESSENQISLTGPDSRNLMSSKNISGVGYNIQAATDGKHKLFVHAHIGGSTDKRELTQAALDIKSVLRLRRFKTVMPDIQQEISYIYASKPA